MNQNTDNGYTDSVGNNTISSIIIAKSNFDQETIHESRGEVILYTKDNCGKSDTDPTKQIKSCHIPIQNVTSGQIDILSFCSMPKNVGGDAEKIFKEGDEVMSFEITGSAGLVLSNSERYAGNENTNCMYFNKSSLGGGTCFASIQKTPIYTIGGKTPKSFIIIPDN